jgi:methyl-accepting chemotaxis protein
MSKANFCLLGLEKGELFNFMPDLDPEFEVSQFAPELKSLGFAVNSVLHSLTQIIDYVNQTTDLVSNASHEVYSGSNDLNASTQQVAAALAQTNASLSSIAEKIQSNTLLTRNSFALIERISKDATLSAQTSSKAIEAMEAVSASSKQIENITELTDSLAFQTNLLALNAAVEAARAGEQGRGFAVVAQEVRALAQRSGEASKNIKAIVSQTASEIEESFSFVQQMTLQLTEMVVELQKAMNTLQEVTQNSIEQSEGVGQVSQAMNEVEGLSHKNTSLVEGTSAISRSLKSQAESLTEVMQFFKSLP